MEAWNLRYILFNTDNTDDSLAVLQNLSSYKLLETEKRQERPLDRFIFDYPYLVVGDRNDEINSYLLAMWQLSLAQIDSS